MPSQILAARTLALVFAGAIEWERVSVGVLKFFLLGNRMDKTLVTAGIFVVPTMLLVLWFWLTGRWVKLVPLFWAGFSYFVYFLLLRSRDLIPMPAFVEELDLNWVGKTLSLTGTLAILYFLPRVSFRAAGLTWTQNKDSLIPVILTGGAILVVTTSTAALVATTPNTSLENLLFQATMPGLDEEIFMRGLLLLLLHQAFGKGFAIWGAETGWAIWLVTAYFGLIHGVSVVNGELAVNIQVIVLTGFIGFVLTWMRERTGSLVIPTLFHNISNVAQAFV